MCCCTFLLHSFPAMTIFYCLMEAWNTPKLKKYIYIFKQLSLGVYVNGLIWENEKCWIMFKLQTTEVWYCWHSETLSYSLKPCLRHHWMDIVYITVCHYLMLLILCFSITFRIVGSHCIYILCLLSFLRNYNSNEWMIQMIQGFFLLHHCINFKSRHFANHLL